MTIKTVAGFVSTIAILAAISSAQAQVLSPQSNSTSGATSASGATSGSRSGAVSTSRGGNAATNSSQTNQQGVSSTTNTGVTLNQTSNAPGNTTANNTSNNRDTFAGGTSNSNSNTNSGYTSSDNIVRTTPTVYAPPVSGGNPCTLAVSGGVSVIGWGAAAGGTFVDQDCADRQKIAMIWNAGFKVPAKELMCNDQKTYIAFRTAGEPCAIRPQWESQAAQPMPTPVGPPQRVTTTQPAPYQPAGRFVCLDARGKEVAAGTPGASCGMI